jgi:hypothetical protein
VPFITGALEELEPCDLQLFCCPLTVLQLFCPAAVLQLFWPLFVLAIFWVELEPVVEELSANTELLTAKDIATADAINIPLFISRILLFI